MTPRMWVEALRTMPRLDKETWDRLDVFARWLIATRAAVLVITFVPCAIAGLLAWREGMFDPLLWVLTTFGLLMAHATNNILNDLTDYWKGVDKGNYFRAQYGVQPLEHGFMSVRQSLTYAAATGFLAFATGMYLVWVRGPVTLGLMASGCFFVLFYTWPLKYIGLGEFAVLAVWGPLMTGGAYFVVTGAWDWMVVLAGLPCALGATSVLFGKHIDKLEPDKAKGIRTLPVLIGEQNARVSVLVMIALQYALVAYLVVTGYFSFVMLAVLIALKDIYWVWLVYSSRKPAERPAIYPEEVWPLFYVALAFLHSRDFGLVFLGGLLVDAVLRNVGILG